MKETSISSSTPLWKLSGVKLKLSGVKLSGVDKHLNSLVFFEKTSTEGMGYK